MAVQRWREAAPARRVQLLRWTLPIVFAGVVIVYQLGFATYIHNTIGHDAHTLVEIVFYSVAGPFVTWLTLGMIGRWLRERDALERTARAQEQHLASIVDASADAILSLDDSGVIRTWNRGAERVFGYLPQEIIGQSLKTLLADDPPSEQSVFSLLTADTLLQNYEITCLTKEGRVINVEVTRTPLHLATEDVSGASVIMRDISQRKAREALLKEERARIARDLHDGLAQDLYFMGLKLDYVRKVLEQRPAEAAEELALLKQTVQKAIREVRRSIFALRPIDVAEKGLAQAMRMYAQAFGEQTGLEIAVTCNGDVNDTPEALQPLIFRVVQECLNNVAKHADTTHARIELTCQGEVCRVEVQDDGQGFDPEAQMLNGHHLGLRQMRERVEEAGGLLTVQSSPEQGTLVRAEIPLRGWT